MPLKSGHKITRIATHETRMPAADESISVVFRYMLLGIIITGTLVILYYILLERKKTREFRLSEEKFWRNLK